MKKNFFYNALNTFTTYFFSILTLMYVSRILQPETLGRINFSNAVISYFSLFASMGIPVYGLRECATYQNNKEKLSSTVKELILIGIILSTLSLSILCILCIFNTRMHTERHILWILGSQLLFIALGSEWLYQALEKFKVIAIRNITIKILLFILILLFVKNPNNYLIYSLFMAANSILIYSYNLIGLRKYINFKAPIRKDFLKRHMKPILVFFMMSCATTIYANIDLVMLGFMDTNYIVGCYGVVEKMKTVLTITGGLVWMVALPKATAYWTDHKKSQFVELARQSMGIVLFIQIPVMFITLILSKAMILVLVGNKYADAATCLSLIGLSIFPIAISNIIGTQILVPTNNEKRLLFAEVTGAIVNIILNFILIHFWSMYGAAISTVIAEITVTACTIYSMNKYLHIKVFNYKEISTEILAASISTFIVIIIGIIIPGTLHFFIKAMIQVIIFLSVYIIILKKANNSIIEYVQEIIKRNWFQNNSIKSILNK